MNICKEGAETKLKKFNEIIHNKFKRKNPVDAPAPASVPALVTAPVTSHVNIQVHDHFHVQEKKK